jgi:hypothetical protein
MSDGRERKDTRRMRGFERASGLVQSRIRTAGERRGFAVARLLTHWEEIVGAATASVARPVKVSYAQGGFGATLTILTTGAQAPMLQAELPRIRERVNACYGYNAIARIRITQTAPTGFAEGQAEFSPPSAAAPAPPDPALRDEARRIVPPVADEGLRAALEALGENILSRTRKKERQET